MSADPLRVHAGASEGAFRVALWVGRRLGDLLYLALPGRRRTALGNLRVAFPDRPARERRRICRRCFQQIGMMLVESVIVLWKPSVMAERVTVEGLERLTGALARSPGGALVLTAHFGNWELLSLGGKLTGVPFATVVRPLDSRALNLVAERLRATAGIEWIEKRRALPAVQDALRRGRAVGILLDQNAARPEGVFVPFFGRLASTSRALAVLALRTGAPILPAFIHREPDGRHRVIIEPPVAPPAARRSVDAAVEALTAECSQRIEATVRRWPEQWFWLHRRWRTRPVGERARA